MTDKQIQFTSPQQALRALRLIWGGLLGGQVVFMFIVASLIDGKKPQTDDPQMHTILTYIPFGLLVVMVALGYFVRSQTYKRYWRGDVVTPIGYFIGNLLLLALCEGVSFVGLAISLTLGTFIPPIFASALAMGVQAINFPHGRPMQPHPLS